jgi:hypothetical protein
MGLDGSSQAVPAKCHVFTSNRMSARWVLHAYQPNHTLNTRPTTQPRWVDESRRACTVPPLQQLQDTATGQHDLYAHILATEQP